MRPRAEATTPQAAGAGDTVIDYEYPEPAPPPVTTIAWRMGHISIGIFGMRAANHFGDGGVGYESTDWPLTAAGGLDLLERCVPRLARRGQGPRPSTRSAARSGRTRGPSPSIRSPR